MLIKASPKVIALMQAKAAELQATTRRENSKATLLRAAALGLGLSGVAVVIVACCVGYAKIQEPETKAAKAYMAAMKKPVKVEVTVSGNVGVKDGAQVSLVKGSMVGMSPDSTVGLDPHATVRAVVDAARPSPAQIQADAKPASGAPVVTNFVIFKKAPYGGKGGEVQSGWEFIDSNKQTPSMQWCAYVEREADGTQQAVTLGDDGARAALPNPSPFPSVDLQNAFASCVWSSSRTPNRQTAPSSPRVISARAKG